MLAQAELSVWSRYSMQKMQETAQRQAKLAAIAQQQEELRLRVAEDVAEKERRQRELEELRLVQ